MKPFFTLIQYTAIAVVCVTSANAAVVTTPAGTITGTGNSSGTATSDPLVADAWFRDQVRGGTDTGITTNFPRNSNGSAYFKAVNAAGDGSGKADWVYYKTGGFGKLSELPTYSYDWYRKSSTSTVATHLHPAIRLIIDIDGVNVGTSSDIGYLIFERAYNPSVSPVPMDQWVTETITGSTNLWFNQPGPGVQMPTHTLSEYQSGSYTPSPGFSQVTGNSVVIGISMGVGSGWTGIFEGAVDNPNLPAFNFTSNFELAAPAAAAPVAVPALDLVGLLALSGAVGVAASAITSQRRTTRPSKI